MKRMIDDALFRSPEFGQLDCVAKLLYLGIVANADDQGRLLADPSYLRSLVFPFEDHSVERIGNALADIGVSRLLILYHVEDQKIVQIADWWPTQTPQFAQLSKLPAPPGWEDRLRFTLTKGKIATHNWARRDGSRSVDTCNRLGLPRIEPLATEPPVIEPPVIEPPDPTPVTGFRKDWSEDLDRENAPTQALLVVEPVSTDKAAKIADIDPRRFGRNGRIPAEKGTTPLEVYYEFVSVRTVSISDWNREQLTAAVADLGKWRSVCAKWHGRQYKPDNIVGLLDWYENGIREFKANITNDNGKPDAAGDSGSAGLSAPVPAGSRSSLSSEDAKRLLRRKKA